MLREQFIKIDQDNSGQINLAELRAAIEKTGQKSGESINNAIANIDVDGDGSISYEEFLAAVIERQLIHRQNKVWWAFCEYDQDSDGKITVEELKKALTEQGVIKDGETTKETNEKVASYIAEYDLNGDGVIDYEEFMKMLLPKDTKYKIKPDA
jgi:Ca2+-binding EF-hand superfamily protein